MEPIIFSVVLLIAMPVAFTLLWKNGYLTVSKKTAAKFMGSVGSGSRPCRLRFAACTGTVTRTVRFHESRRYTFSLQAALSKGSLKAELQNSDHDVLLVLDANTPTARLYADDQSRYYLVLRFDHANGDLTLSWQ